jgi:dihydropyrimidinase
MLVIAGGTVVSPDGEYLADVYVDGERIVALGRDLQIQTDRQIDANGCYVLPGCVDPHTHMDMPFGKTATCDDFTSGSIAAACGGTTCHVDFCMQQPGDSPRQSLERWFAKLEQAPPVVDVGFHLAITNLSKPGYIEEVASLPDDGITSFKLFMAYRDSFMVEDDVLFQTMEVAARTGALTMVHAENGYVVDVLVKRALAKGDVGTVHHGLTRPPLVEAEATARAITLARLAGSPLYVVHVSCQEALSAIEAAQDDNAAVRAETCTHYFVTEQSQLDQPDFEGGKYVFTPPPRNPNNHAYLWDGIERGSLCVVSSDHAPFRHRDQKALGRDDFSKIPNGAPGIEERLMIVHELGVNTGRITRSRLVQLLATEPARLFGLFPRKGILAPGSDADIVVFDPGRERVLEAGTLNSRVDYTLYEGMHVTGAPRDVLVRGIVVVEGGKFIGSPGHGRFLKRDVTSLATANGVSDRTPRAVVPVLS